MNNLNFPLNLKFKIATLASDFTVTDNQGQNVAYVRQKMFKLKEDVVIFSDDSRSQELFRIKANQWLDFNSSYLITDTQGNAVGKLARKGMRSIWKATYQVIDPNDQQLFTISEENAWVKFFDGLVGEIPIVGAFTGYFLNPAYILKNQNGKVLFRLKKLPSFWGRHFQLEKLGEVPQDQEKLVVLGYMMMVLLERSRG